MSEPDNVGANTPQTDPAQLDTKNYRKEDVAKINLELTEAQSKLNKLISNSKSTSKQHQLL